jgi:hypothetical protein
VTTPRLYGQIARNKEKTWVIQAEPQVTIKYKRIFEKINKAAYGVMLIKDSREACRDILWMLERYPLEINAYDLRYLRARAAEHRRLEQDVSNIVSTEYKPREFELALPPREYQRVAADLLLRRDSLLLADELGLGKQQPIDTNVLTPHGWRKIGHLLVGDKVIGSDGKSASVTGVFPQGIKPSYRVHFDDGSSVEAGPEHLWAVAYFMGGRSLQEMTLTTDQIRMRPVIQRQWPGAGTRSLDLSRTKLYIPVLSSPVEFAPAAPLRLPPYLAGQLIANGALSDSTISLTCHTNDWRDIHTRLLAERVDVGAVHVYGGATRVGIRSVLGTVRDLGMNVLSGSKSIPECFMRAAPADRIAFFQGLMDGDGSCSSERNKVSYDTTSPRLAEQVVELVRLLGGRAAATAYDRSHQDKPTEHVIRIRMPNSIPPFSTSRKLSRLSEVSRRSSRRITGVDYVRDVESVCIMVDADDHLYATEHGILTHNTASAICALVAPDALPALIIVPTHIQRQWQREINRFAPGLSTHILKKGTPYDLTKVGRRTVPFPDVIISSYGKTAGGWSDVLAGEIRYLVLDECQELRHRGTQKYDAIAFIAKKAERRLGMSATPIHGYGGELWNVMNIISPGELGDFDEFTREWCKSEAGYGGTSKAIVREPKAFGMYLREQGLMLRRTRADVKRELPPLTKIIQHVDVDMKPIDDVRSAAAELARIILKQGGSGIEKMRAAEELDWRLRQATGIAKAVYCADFVRMLVEQGEPVILAAWHREVHAIIMERLDDLKPVMYTGSESLAEKERSRAAFISGESQVLLISLRSGAGLDGLQQRCNTIVHAELDWACAVHDQLDGRAHRDGQADPVMAYYMLSDSGSDPVISDCLGLKRQQLDGIRDPDAAPVVGATDPNRVRRLAEAFLEQQMQRRDRDEEAA